MKAQDLQRVFVDLPCALRRRGLAGAPLPVEAAAGQPYSAAGTGGLRRIDMGKKRFDFSWPPNRIVNYHEVSLFEE